MKRTHINLIPVVIIQSLVNGDVIGNIIPAIRRVAGAGADMCLTGRDITTPILMRRRALPAGLRAG